MYTFYIKAAGVTFEGRQATVRRLHIGEALRLEAEPSNLYDLNAVKILTAYGASVGYIPKEYNRNISLNLRNGNGRYSAKVSSITGMEYGRYGVNIEVTYYD